MVNLIRRLVKSGRFWRYVRLAIGLIFIVALVPTFNDPAFLTTLTSVSVPLLLLSFALSLISIWSKAWRWDVVLRWRGIHLPQSYLILSYFVGTFFNNFLPSGVGGDAVRAYEAARDTGRGAETIIAVIIERGSGMLAVFAAGSLGALLVPNQLDPKIAFLAHALFIGSLVAIWALWLDVTGKLLAAIGARFPDRLQGAWSKLTRIYEEFRLYRHEWRLLAEVMWQSVVTLMLTLASVYVLLLAFGKQVSFAEFAAAFSIFTAIDVVPVSVNGLGVRESLYVILLSPLIAGTPSVQKAVALGVALLVRLIALIEAAMGGVIFVWRNLRKAKQPATE